MALLSEHKADCYRWGIWKTDESLEELLALLPGPEKYEQQLKRFSSLHRQLEWLSVRVLLYRLLGEEKSIEYAPSGKPRLADSSFFFSVISNNALPPLFLLVFPIPADMWRLS